MAQDLTAPALPSANRTADLINQLHQREWVRLDAEGNVRGTLMTLAADGSEGGRVGAKIVLSKDGEVLFETKSDVGGEFSISGVEPGTYALQVVGDVTRAAYALHIMPNDEAHLSSDLQVYASVIRKDRANELLTSNLAPEWEAGQDLYYRSYEADPIADSREFNTSHHVVLRDGNLVGRVSRPGWTFAEQDLTGTVAQIVREGDVVATAAVNRQGFFTVQDLKPGVYDLFVSGDDGYAILAFEAVEPMEPVASASDGAVRFVSTQVGMATDCLCCEMVHQPETICCEVVEEVIEPVCECGTDPCSCGQTDPCGSPVCGGGFAGHGGGFYGGGGGGGGFGGIGGGGLLGAAGLAVGIAALATQDDDGFNQNIPTPIAP
jgi:hypothetical protein